MSFAASCAAVLAGTVLALTSAGGEDNVRVTAVELRHVLGLPFYALELSDGTTAFALAVSEETLSAVPGAADTYARLMAEGIENNVTLSGGE